MKHGTFVSYRNGCHCADCTSASRAYQRDWQRRKRTGTATRVSAIPAQQYVAFLLSAGMTQRAIADIAGIGRDSVHGLALRRNPKILRASADAVMGITVDDIPAGRRQWLPPRAVAPMVAMMQRAGMASGDVERAIKVRPARLRNRGFIQRITYDRAVIVCRILARQGIVPASVLEEVGA